MACRGFMLEVRGIGPICATSPTKKTRLLLTASTVTATVGSVRNFFKRAVMSALSWVGVRPAAMMSPTRASEIMPSGRTGTAPDRVGSLQTVMRMLSSGPMTYVEGVMFAAEGSTCEGRKADAGNAFSVDGGVAAWIGAGALSCGAGVAPCVGGAGTCCAATPMHTGRRLIDKMVERRAFMWSLSFPIVSVHRSPPAAANVRYRVESNLCRAIANNRIFHLSAHRREPKSKIGSGI